MEISNKKYFKTKAEFLSTWEIIELIASYSEENNIDLRGSLFLLNALSEAIERWTEEPDDFCTMMEIVNYNGVDYALEACNNLISVGVVTNYPDEIADEIKY